MARRPLAREDARMQVIAAAPPAGRTGRVTVVRSAVAAVLLIVVGALLGYLFVATPVIGSLAPSGRPSATEAAVAILTWGFAIVVPAGLMLVGVAKVMSTLEAMRDLHPNTVTPRLARALGPDHVAATNLVIPGGRRIHELVLGPFGIVVLGDVPPPSMSRHVGTRWEVRGARGRWIPIEAPLDRAARDAERVRGWLATDDRDFLVKVYAAVVTDDERVERTPACAVVRSADLAAWLEALPAQRGLTPGRRERLVELLRSVAVAR
jgi:hypothetical protein